MSNYTKSTDFASKDALTSGDPAKVIRGTEIDAELVAIATAITSKAESSNPTFTGTATMASISLSGTLDGGSIDGGTY